MYFLLISYWETSNIIIHYRTNLFITLWRAPLFSDCKMVITSISLMVFFVGCLQMCIYADKVRYTNEWIVEVGGGGSEVADEIAQKHGFQNLGKVYITR